MRVADVTGVECGRPVCAWVMCGTYVFRQAAVMDILNHRVLDSHEAEELSDSIDNLISMTNMNHEEVIDYIRNLYGVYVVHNRIEVRSLH